LSADHPGLAALRAAFAARMANRHALSMAERRAAFAGLMAQLNPCAAPPSVRLAGCAAELAGTPADQAVLYLHGGAYVSGSPATHRHFGLDLARRAGLPVYMLDYRLAPEHPFPAAPEDAFAAYQALLASHTHVAVAGDSAGGGLSLAVALLARARGVAMPACLVLLSPFVDLSLTAPSCTERAPLDPFLTRDGLAADVQRYLGDADRRMPLASPLFADLAGLPPTLVQAGTDEILFDDFERIAAALTEAGVSTTFEPWPGMVHNWHLFPNWLPEAGDATAGIAAFINRHIFHGASPA